MHCIGFVQSEEKNRKPIDPVFDLFQFVLYIHKYVPINCILYTGWLVTRTANGPCIVVNM